MSSPQLERSALTSSLGPRGMRPSGGMQRNLYILVKVWNLSISGRWQTLRKLSNFPQSALQSRRSEGNFTNQLAGTGQKGISSSEISADCATSSCPAGPRWSKLAVEPDELAARLYPPELAPPSSRPESSDRSLTMISVR